MPAWRKWTRAIVNITFKGLGLGVAASPAIVGVKNSGGDYGSIPKNVLYEYSGVDLGNPAGGVNVGQLTGGVAAVIGGIVLAKIGSFLARHF